MLKDPLAPIGRSLGDTNTDAKEIFCEDVGKFSPDLRVSDANILRIFKFVSRYDFSV